MIKIFDGETADEVWTKSASELFSYKSTASQMGRGGVTEEILQAVYTIQNPRQRWVLSRQPSLNPAFAIAEVIWILSGRNDASFLTFWNTSLGKYSGNAEYYHGAYGYRLRKSHGLDQLERAYLSLQNNPNSRQTVLQIWHPAADFPQIDGSPANPDIPCNICALLKIRNDKLEWTQILRSNDVIRGVPYNFVQFTSIQEVLAGWLGVDVGSYNHLSDSLHLYQKDQDKFCINNVKDIANSDSLCLPKNESDIALADVNNRTDILIDSNLSRVDLLTLVKDNDLHTAYYNLFLILAAETARRRGWIGDIDAIISKCSNLLLIHIWNKWFERFRRFHKP